MPVLKGSSLTVSCSTVSILNVTTPVNVKWAGKKFDNIELNPDESPALFKAQLYTLTGVEPERQKILVKGGTLKDDTDLNKLNLKQMMGTAGELPKAPEKPIVFMEDMSDNELARALEVPMGLQNLGNTCYMNSTLQCLRVMPELKESLNRFNGNVVGGVDPSNNLVASLRDLFKQLDQSGDSIAPLVFLQMLRTVYPKFSQQEAGGIFMQQDAEECWTSLVSVLKEKLGSSVDAQNFVDQYMYGEFTTTLKCDENAEEEPSISAEQFAKLDCFISGQTNFMQQGITEGLEQKIEKNSPSLGRSASYTKSSKVSRLPAYLAVNFVRFFWKPTERIKTKILRKVKFPFDLDMTQFCTPDLQEKIAPVKSRLLELEDKRQAEVRKAKLAKSNPGTGESSTSMDVDQPVEEAVSFDDIMHKDLASDLGCNPSGQYELCAVLTHMGRTADSGHYIAWVKKADSDDWLKYDDDKVSIVKQDEITKLDGGGDWHIAYICLYRSKKLA
ncbi:cysteine proteinase [Basidiobolus meristosporus CBS 931.73]|uniref:Ubiquitin carboxyl-terminal hydrolase n=1 Tax=Basidiobolus meristosporus CBS 931.73 TaxID=1314790 RepID=A0A1Y1XXX3_9FUNG|nr:cysteine proteinase [Basidiobolus meristosporus CBS 931.73]|eukprot:ORX90326.1 cysteine proteinase [Basidiobolus meristosporus CBS 931.73]